MSEDANVNEQPNDGSEATGSAPDTNAATQSTEPKAGDEVGGLKAALKAERSKRQEYEKALKEWETEKQKRADDEAQKAGQIDKFKAERDQFKSEAEQWREYATSKLEGIANQLDDAGKAILDDLGEDVSLAKRLGIAERLASQKKQPAAFGTNGGNAPTDTGWLIPPEARTSRTAYEQWLSDLTNSGDPQKMAVLVNSQKRAQLEAEARKLFG